MRPSGNPGRFVGLLYVLVSILGAFAVLYVPSKLIVDGNATVTASNIAASETLFPLGLLVYRSGFLPRILGVLLMANCFSFVANSLTSLLLPQYEHVVDRWMMPLQFGEVLFMLWLLIRGATPKPLVGPV
jgi:hypothetical protein